MRGAILGPQQTRQCLRQAVDAVCPTGRATIITSGWQEREAQDAEVRAWLNRDCINLRIYERADAVFEADKELATAHRSRQDELRLIQEFYRLRLERLYDAAIDIERKVAGTQLQEDEERLSMEQARRLDAEHLDRCAALRAEFDEKLRPLERDSVRTVRDQIKQDVDESDVVVVAGGHVASLFNRLWLFGVRDFLLTKPFVGWSAGAMVASERIVLFHENPPDGLGISEVLDCGLNLFRAVLPLPNPRMRLKLDDPLRTGWLARRYAPLKCIALDQGDWVGFDGDTWTAGRGSQQLMPDGTVRDRWFAA